MSWRGWGAFAALGIIWGLPYFFIKLALQELSPATIAWGRVVLGTLILLPIAWKRGALRAVMEHKAAVCAFAVVEFVVPFLAISLAERWISSSLIFCGQQLAPPRLHLYDGGVGPAGGPDNISTEVTKWIKGSSLR